MKTCDDCIEADLHTAAREIERALKTFRTEPGFALGCIGDARLALAAAKVGLGASGQGRGWAPGEAAAAGGAR